MDAATRASVRERAGDRCEYCHLRQADSPLAPLHVEHIVPRKHGGADQTENLALACVDFHKGPNLTGIDPVTNEITKLFDPRKDHWEDHFEWKGTHIVGRTAVGRVTIRVLKMNSDDQLALRFS